MVAWGGLGAVGLCWLVMGLWLRDGLCWFFGVLVWCDGVLWVREVGWVGGKGIL